MENFYQSWLEFQKSQTHGLKGKKAPLLLDQAAQAALSLKDTPLPQGEDWRYVNFKSLKGKNFQWLNEDKANRLFLEDHHTTIEIKNFSKPKPLEGDPLPPGLLIHAQGDVDQAMALIPKPSPELSKSSPRAFIQNPFFQFSKAFYGLGLHIQVGPEACLGKPLLFVFDYDSFSQKDLLLLQNIHLEILEKAHQDVYFEFKGENLKGLSHICLKARVREKGTLNLFIKEFGGEDSHFLFNAQVEVEALASFKSLDMTLSPLWSRHNLSVDLLGKKAKAHLKGTYLNREHHFVDHHSCISHHVGQTQSFQDYRGILTHRAQGVFNGKLFIAPGAALSKAHQMNKNLMLSKAAEIYSKPELQIYNDDVKASHGATVGQMDEEQKFYLQTRGYSSPEARRVLSKAFAFDLMEKESKLTQGFFRPEFEKTLEDMEGPR